MKPVLYAHDKPPTEKKLNVSMLFLQCVGIFAVVMGHANLFSDDIPDPIALAFPYYSWHMPFFIFISGYFFNRTEKMGSYVLKKVRHLLLPAFVVNAACGILALCIKEWKLGDYAEDISISLRSFFVTPFTTGYQFYINVALWFIFALFVIEMLSMLMDRAARGKGDLIFLGVTLIIALYCCYVPFNDFEGTREEFYNAGLRLGFLMFFFWLGICYRRYFEPYVKKVLNFKWSILLFCLQATFLGVTGYEITPNIRNMKFVSLTVPNGFWLAIVTPITATLFFLGLAYSLEPYLQHSKLLPIIGRNTKYVVYYHQIVFIIFSYSIGALMRLDILKLPDFSLKELATNQYYIGDNLPIKTVIALLAVILPILICRPIDRQKWYIRAALYAGLMLLIIGLMYLCSLTIA